MPVKPYSEETAAQKDESSGLLIVKDSRLVIRRLYGSKPPTAGEMVEALVRDLIVLSSLPIQVDHIDGWWLVSSAKDWLIQSDGLVSFCSFEKIVHFPEAGLEACHSEIILATFADPVITKGAKDEITWIVGDQQRWALPPAIIEQMQANAGRIVVFRSDEHWPRAAPLP